jgi:peptidoglycan/xylan/chitin deacetylase (PgdA/CDA1 family)
LNGVSARLSILVAAIFSFCAATAVDAKRGQIALTFDDLPALTILDNQPYVNYLNAALLRGLKRHGMPAIGFVNEGKFDEIDRKQQIDVLQSWLKAGMNLGNHTYSHESPNTVGPTAYIKDIARGEAVTRPMLAQYHRQLRWFRHPYLETGFPLAVKRRIDEWLTDHGYTIAPVTMENSDWLFAEPYDDAIARHDEAHRQHIRQAYLAYTDRAIGWYQDAARSLFGRQIAFVMLLHATRLNADCLDDLAVLLQRHKLRAVTLERAMKDPTYRTHDPYAGKDGIEWLERWSIGLHKELPWKDFTDPPVNIQAEYNRIDADQ